MATIPVNQRRTGLHPPLRLRNGWALLMTAVVLLVSIYLIQGSDATTLQARDTRMADGVELRVLPIGDSITWGAQSSDENGYRETLFKKLAARGNRIDFVGGTVSGDMSDPQHEGHRGYVIADIGNESGTGLYSHPNVVLLHAGTNDMKNPTDVPAAAARLKDLAQLILSINPKAAVLVCQIVPSTDAAVQDRINQFNRLVPGVVSELADDGHRVLLVSMNEALSNSDMADRLHPNDGGYLKMANAYYDAIEAADQKGWITEPGDGVSQLPGGVFPEQPDSDTCQSPKWRHVGMIATGPDVAKSDGTFSPSWKKIGVVAEGACSRERVHFMDLDGDGLKDYACVDPDTGETKVHLNIPDAQGKTSGEWKALGTIATGREGRDGTGVFFTDLNGDGMDDYIYVDPANGEVYGWINRGEGEIWKWESLGRIAGGVGATIDNLHMADLNGDGRADFCLINPDTGEMRAWINTGAVSRPDFHDLGIVGTGATFASGDRVILGDYTGEGRADYMIVRAGGEVLGFANRIEEATVAPRWFNVLTIADGPEGAEQEEVRLVDMTGDGKVDYLLVGPKGRVTLWENLGTGGKYQPGQGVFLCDLDGDGTSDYFWIDQTGKGWGYLNKGKGSDSWKNLGQIAEGVVRLRVDIRMGILTKSGRADYIVVDQDTGRAQWWENLGEEGGWDWQPRGEFATGPWRTIEETYGWKFKGENVRFADLDGDGLDDYLYVEEKGAVVMWRHQGTNPPSWGLPHLVAEGAGVLPSTIQFADTNGDGLLDYVVVGPVTGSARVWLNQGVQGDGSIQWSSPVYLAGGVGSAGFAVKFSEMTGDSRADYVSVDPNTGRLNSWENRCSLLPDVDDDTPLPSTELNWRNVTCQDPGVIDATDDPAWRWEQVLAQQAYFEAVQTYTRIPKDERASFVVEVSNFLNGPEHMDCGNLQASNGCQGGLRCSTPNDPGPATFFICNSFAVISGGEIGLFTDIFAPSLEEGLDIFVVLDIVAMGYASAVAPLWNGWLRNFDWSKAHGDGYDTLKDFANDMTYQGITLAKDVIGSDERRLSNFLSSQISAVVQAWRNSTEEYARGLFNGSQESRDRLGRMIANGKMNTDESKPYVGDLVYAIKKSLYALLIPMAWRISGQDLNPFVIDTGLSCDDAPKDDDLKRRLDDDTREKKLICDKEADRGYYLVSAVQPDKYCHPVGNTGGNACQHFKDLPGAEFLEDGEGDGVTGGWNAVSQEDIVFGSVATFKANGNKNLKSGQARNTWNSFGDWEDTLSDLADGDIRTPYFINLPICRVNEALGNYYSTPKERPFYFPCNEEIDWDAE